MIAPELFPLLFLFMGVGMLMGALVHAGLDERGPREVSWSPNWYQTHRYKRAVKNRPLAEHEREGRELTAFLEAVDTIENLKGGTLDAKNID